MKAKSNEEVRKDISISFIRQIAREPEISVSTDAKIFGEKMAVAIVKHYVGFPKFETDEKGQIVLRTYIDCNKIEKAPGLAKKIPAAIERVYKRFGDVDLEGFALCFKKGENPKTAGKHRMSLSLHAKDIKTLIIAVNRVLDSDLMVVPPRGHSNQNKNAHKPDI